MLMVMVLRNLNRGAITPMFNATATPTRTMLSFAGEKGETYFIAGDLDRAIELPARLSPWSPPTRSCRLIWRASWYIHPLCLNVDASGLARLE